MEGEFNMEKAVELTQQDYDDFYANLLVGQAVRESGNFFVMVLDRNTRQQVGAFSLYGNGNVFELFKRIMTYIKKELGIVKLSCVEVSVLIANEEL